MPTVQMYLGDLKRRKMAIWANLVGQSRLRNHPHRLGSMRLAGDFDYTSDNRPQRAANTSATKVDYLLSFDLTFPRVFPARMPFRADFPPFYELDPEEFILAHSVSEMWKARHFEGGGRNEVVGTRTVTQYTRATTSDPWSVASTTDNDISVELFRPLLSGGGIPSVGFYGGHGRGDGGDDESIEVAVSGNWTGAGATALPLWDNVQPIYRLPWENAWAAESDAFAAWFDDWLNNLPTTADHTGSCSLELAFAAL